MWTVRNLIWTPGGPLREFWSKIRCMRAHNMTCCTQIGSNYEGWDAIIRVFWKSKGQTTTEERPKYVYFQKRSTKLRRNTGHFLLFFLVLRPKLWRHAGFRPTLTSTQFNLSRWGPFEAIYSNLDLISTKFRQKELSFYFSRQFRTRRTRCA